MTVCYCLHQLNRICERKKKSNVEPSNLDAVKFSSVLDITDDFGYIPLACSKYKNTNTKSVCKYSSPRIIFLPVWLCWERIESTFMFWKEGRPKLFLKHNLNLAIPINWTTPLKEIHKRASLRHNISIILDFHVYCSFSQSLKVSTVVLFHRSYRDQSGTEI